MISQDTSDAAQQQQLWKSHAIVTTAKPWRLFGTFSNIRLLSLSLTVLKTNLKHNLLHATSITRV